MAQSDNLLGLYLHLAWASEQRNRPWVRDKFLVLAAVTSSGMGLEQIAAYCRLKILANNPGHLVGHYPTIAEALDDERFQGFLTQLGKRYSRERAEHMLSSLGIDLARERDAYFSDHEYAASLLGTTPEELESLFNPRPGAQRPARPPAIAAGEPRPTANRSGRQSAGGQGMDEPGVGQPAPAPRVRGWWINGLVWLIAIAAAIALGIAIRRGAGGP